MDAAFVASGLPEAGSIGEQPPLYTIGTFFSPVCFERLGGVVLVRQRELDQRSASCSSACVVQQPLRRSRA
jgi:hypothetical protein